MKVEAQLWPEQARSLSLEMRLGQGGYFAASEGQSGQEDARVQVHAHHVDDGVQLGEPVVQASHSARRSHLRVPLDVDDVRCAQGCAATLELRARVCREPGLCHDVVRPVTVQLTSEPTVPSRLGFVWY